MAVEVFGRDATLGEDDAGFSGNGGGALSGSELSHLRHDINLWFSCIYYSKHLHRHNRSAIIR
jgi:hypothetical protein